MCLPTLGAKGLGVIARTVLVLHPLCVIETNRCEQSKVKITYKTHMNLYIVLPPDAQLRLSQLRQIRLALKEALSSAASLRVSPPITLFLWTLSFCTLGLTIYALVHDHLLYVKAAVMLSA
jgi:positive regulator of sigma E activity